MKKPKLGWWLLIASVATNIVLGLVLWLRDPPEVATQQIGLVFALSQCTKRLERYAEVKATAEAYDQMLEKRDQYAIKDPP